MIIIWKIYLKTRIKPYQVATCTVGQAIHELRINNSNNEDLKIFKNPEKLLKQSKMKKNYNYICYENNFFLSYLAQQECFSDKQGKIKKNELVSES